MEKNKNTIAFLVIVIIILFSIIVLTFTGVIKISRPNSKKTEEYNQNLHLVNTPKVDVALIQKFVDNYSTSFSSLLILNGSWNNTGNKFNIKKNTNYLEKEEYKQQFVMEKIVADKSTHKNFIIFNSIGEIDKDETCVNCDATPSYYPYNLFNNEFNKVFNKNFDMTKKKTSEYSKISKDDDSDVDYSKADIIKYEKSNDYVYYNLLDGVNGMGIEKIDVLDTNYNDDTKKFSSNLKLTYTERLKQASSESENSAKLVYDIIDNNIILESFTVE